MHYFFVSRKAAKEMESDALPEELLLKAVRELYQKYGGTYLNHFECAKPALHSLYQGLFQPNIHLKRCAIKSTKFTHLNTKKPKNASLCTSSVVQTSTQKRTLRSQHKNVNAASTDKHDGVTVKSDVLEINILNSETSFEELVSEKNVPKPSNPPSTRNASKLLGTKQLRCDEIYNSSGGNDELVNVKIDCENSKDNILEVENSHLSYKNRTCSIIVERLPEWKAQKVDSKSYNPALRINNLINKVSEISTSGIQLHSRNNDDLNDKNTEFIDQQTSNTPKADTDSNNVRTIGTIQAIFLSDKSDSRRKNVKTNRERCLQRLYNNCQAAKKFKKYSGFALYGFSKY